MKHGWETAIYPKAEYVPWRYISPTRGTPTYYRYANHPIAVVQHIQEGYQQTYVNWARTGHWRASIHFSVGRNGKVYQFLELRHGGYHAGITADKARRYPPAWPLWKGAGVNVNRYTVGVEHEGFHTGWPWPDAQVEASLELNAWLADILEIPMTETRFPPHAAIDLRDRPYDFAPPADRRRYYDILTEHSTLPQKVEDEPMTPEERTEFNAAVAKLNRVAEDTHWLKQITFGNATPIVVTAGNAGVVKEITGEDFELGDEIMLRGNDAFTFAHRMGLSLMLAHRNLNNAVERIAEEASGIGDGRGIDVTQVLRDLADANAAVNG